jgi:hypothetical protein
MFSFYYYLLFHGRRELELENLLKWILVACTLARNLSVMIEEEHEYPSKIYQSLNITWDICLIQSSCLLYQI